MNLLCTSKPLPPPPRFCPTVQLTDSGIVLGEGNILAPLTRRADGAATLALEGREAQIFALLSLAQGRAIHPNVLHGFHGVAKSLTQGDSVAAMIRLAQIGLPPLRGPRDAEMLKNGAISLAKGYSPWMILQAAEIAGPNLRLFKANWNEDLHPRDESTGRFTSGGGSSAPAPLAPVPSKDVKPVPGRAGTMVLPSVASALVNTGEAVLSTTAAAVGGAVLSLTAAGWVLFHGPKGSITDGPSYWLPGVPNESASDEDGKSETPGLGHNGGPALDPTQNQSQPDPDQKPPPFVIAPPSASRSRGDAATQQNDTVGSADLNGWSSTASRAASENALSHWNKHASEFPEFSSVDEYVTAAQNFIQNPPDGTLSKTRANGDTLLYDPRTNTFAISNGNGAPRTMFRPQDGSSYWGSIK